MDEPQAGPQEAGLPETGPPVEDGGVEGKASGEDGSGDGSEEEPEGDPEERPAGIQPRQAEQISAESLQSPHDPDATYRQKGGEEYPGGYVVGVSETCDPSNEVQLITDVRWPRTRPMTESY